MNYWIIPGISFIAKSDVIDQIINATCLYFKIARSQILGKSREGKLPYARHIAMYLIRERTREKIIDIGKIFDRHHSSVLHAFDKIEDLVFTDQFIKEDLRLIRIHSNLMGRI